MYFLRFRPNPVRGFTLLEVLIATAVTLLLMVGLAQIFKVLGDGITKGRAGLELNNRLRGVIHRVRTDIDNLTVTPRPPIEVGTGQGYLKYYDGPGVDASFVTNPLLNRFGDLDDVLLGTIKAEGSWFTGKVPKFILDKTMPSNADLNGNLIPDDYENLVTISSQFAELAVFVEPLPTQAQYSATTQSNPTRDPIRLAADPTGGFEDTFVGTSGFPDAFRLHYRLLLIRPDLNLGSNVLPWLDDVDPKRRLMIAGPEQIGPEFQVQPPPTGAYIIPDTAGPDVVNLPSPLCDMWRIHQFCDLSVRRVYNSADGLPGAHDYIAANSLEDLAIPKNRFAHVEIPINASYTSLPVLALGPPLSFQSTPLGAFGALQGLPAGVAYPNYFAGGFLHPAFALLGSRSGEDILATDVLAFDIKVFDAAAPLILTSNVVLKPGDPGFVDPGLKSLSNVSPPPVAFGEFVDVCWGSSEKLGALPVPVNVPFQRRFVESLMSGVVIDAAGTRSLSTSFVKSGLYLSDSTGLRIYQPSYDTYTDAYEKDGKLQGTITGSAGVVQFNGTSLMADQGTDGYDNETPKDGVADDVDERETSAPFTSDLRGIQIMVRLEDKGTKQFKQMSTIKEFVTR